MILVKLLVGFQLLGDEDLQEVMNKFAFEKLDGLELKEMVEKESLWVR